MGPSRRGAFAITLLWLLGVALAARGGSSHGLVPSNVDRAAPAYEWRGVLVESAVIGAEALALYWLLFKMKRWSALARTLAACALFGALVAFCILTTVTDMPGWYYVNTLWTMLVLLILAVRLVLESIALAITRRRA
jgi:peptidoglycan/LPS O-acetylase OafA/YrhL